MYIYFTAKYFISYIPQVTLRPLIMSDFFRVTYYPSCVTLLALSSSNIFFLKMHLSQCDQFYFLIDNIFIYYVFWYQSVLVSNYLQISLSINLFLYFFICQQIALVDDKNAMLEVLSQESYHGSKSRYVSFFLEKLQLIIK